MVCIHLDAFHASNQHFPVIFHGFPRFWEPSQAELPNKLRRVSELARSEDLEDFDMSKLLKFLDFSCFAEVRSAGAGTKKCTFFDAFIFT